MTVSSIPKITSDMGPRVPVGFLILRQDNARGKAPNYWRPRVLSLGSSCISECWPTAGL